MKLKDLFSTLEEVFSNWKYSLSAILIFVVFYSVNVFISNFSTIISYYGRFGFFQGTQFFFTIFFVFRQTVSFSSFISIVLIGVLFGILFSLIAYKTNIAKGTSRKIGFFGTIGIFLGVLAPGCAACGVGLLSLLGLSAVAITFLPFDGLELSWLAIGILGFSIIKISQDIRKGGICKI